MRSKELFVELSLTPAQHFRLYYYAAILHLLEHVAQSSQDWDEVFKQFPFLIGYHQELAAHGLDGVSLADASARWSAALLAQEEATTGHLPLRALRETASLDYKALTLLMCAGMIEEDARFGMLFEALQGTPGQHRPTLGLLNEWWQHDGAEIRESLHELLRLGLVEVINPSAPRFDWAIQVPGLVWDALHGETHLATASWIHYRAPEQMSALDDIVLTDELQRALATVPALVMSGEVEAIVLRGPQHNGRRTLLGAVARRLGRGLLELNGLSRADDERWRIVGPLATAMHAVPLISLDLTPGETAELPRLHGYDGALGVVLGHQGGLSGPGAERALTLRVEIPGQTARRRLWERSFAAHAYNDLDNICERYRLTSGYIHRTAGLALTNAMLEGRETITSTDVQQATRALNRQALDTLATRIEAVGEWGSLAVKAETMQELSNLESRCRHRERLQAVVGQSLRGQLNTGVRALFHGSSGTGKTLAARVLASVLKMDLYRLDLASVVNKYIGETEKCLNQIFSRAEELDVILLLDEGDALLTQRTNVSNATDRYANLETNFLLQRLESFEGIIIVTTNASDRIDSAFQRRMDVVINFQTPDVPERAQIWQLHLPAEHSIDRALLDEVARRCTLSGGQIRNAVLHAALLALDGAGRITSAQLEKAVQREYRKMGAVCPLRSAQHTSVELS